MKILLCNMGMESVKKNCDTSIFILKKYLLSGQKYNRPMQARPYTEDFEKILFQVTYHPTLGLWRSHSFSRKFRFQPFQDHRVQVKSLQAHAVCGADVPGFELCVHPEKFLSTLFEICLSVL